MKRWIAIGVLAVLFLVTLGCGQQDTIVRDQSVALAAKLQIPLDQQDAQINERSKEILAKTLAQHSLYLKETQEGKEVLKKLNLAIEGIPIPGLGVMYSADSTSTTVQVPVGKKSLQFFTVGDKAQKRWAYSVSPLGLAKIESTRNPRGAIIKRMVLPDFY